MKTLVIGGTGLISTSVTQQLIDRGDQVTLFNRGQTPSRCRGETKLVVGDRGDRPRFEQLVRQHGPWDVVVDMICSAPEDAESLRRACVGVAGQVIFCSTTNVYPKPAEAYPVREDHRLGAAYKNGVDKAECEALHRQARAEGDYQLTIIRPGHTYGETGGVLHSLGNATSYVDRLRHGKPIIVHGDGNGLWSALHADDVASVFVAAAGNSTAFGRTYNATGEEWMTWDQYHGKVAQALGADPPTLVHIPIDVLFGLAPERAAQSRRSLQYPGIYSMSNTCADLGFRQQISLTAGMRRTIGWLEAHEAIEPWQSDPDYDRIIDAWRAMTAEMPDPELEE